MTDQAGRRRQVLLAWAFVQRNRGEAVPANADLVNIAMARAIPPGLRTPLVNRWAHVLHHLMWLSDQGHPDPVKDALQMAPAGPPIPQAPPPQPPPRQPAHDASAQQAPGHQPPSQHAPASNGGLQARALQAIAALNREIDAAAESARQALAQGREDLARPQLIRRNTLRQRLARLSRGEDPDTVGSAASAASASDPRPANQPGPVERVGAAADAVPPPPVQPPPVHHPPVQQRTGQFPPGQFPPAQFPPGQFPPGQFSPGQSPSDQPAAGQSVPPGPPQFPTGPPRSQHSATGQPSAVEHTAQLSFTPSQEQPHPSFQPPQTPPAQPAEPGPAADPLQRLMMWRNGEGIDQLKDRHLRQIVNSGARTADEVAAGLPASLKPLAAPIAGVLGLGASPSATASDSGAQADPAPDTQPGARPPGTDAGDLLNPRALTWEQPIELAEELGRFAAMDFSEPRGEPRPLKVASRADGSLTLRWPAPETPGRVTIYRVVSNEEYAPVSPDMAEVIAITDQQTLTDSRAFVSAVRHYQVWANTGASIDDALLEQPRLLAELPVVAKPSDIDIREDEGRVIGQWTLLGDVRRVQVFRVPVERAGAGPGNPAYRICAETTNLTGFVDDAAESGRRYLYQLLVEAEVGGAPQLSLPTVIPVTTSTILHPVADLSCTLGDEEAMPRFDLEWSTPPSGRVVIFRTADGPRAGADAETEEESALPQMGLRPEDRLPHPITIEGDRCSMRDVPWPRGWSRTYFTPVTMLDGLVRVGRTTSQVRTGTVSDARLVERVSQQVLTMDWPEGAAAIKVYASSRGQPAAEAIEGAEPIAEISADAYVRLGGLHFPRPLDTGGCDLHLLPISFAGGQAVEGRPTTVSYKGLLKIWYDLDIRRARMGRGPVLLQVRIRSDRPNPTSPAFALIHNPHRLPLDVNDGDAILMQYAGDQSQTPSPRIWPRSLTTTPSEPGWIGDVTGRSGFVRVFVDMPHNPDRGTVALLDPPVAQLYLGGR